ncbi:MAG: ABC transporter ATP-binding protein [Lachnospiraceae bacterium]|nr:ABC transporter ATP-binding protein [Lachnospiraceae bacterium]
MWKMLKFLKKYWAAVAAIVVLLIAQALADLKLPEYTSNIVDTGIQQGGIESIAPLAIRESEWEKLTRFMTEEERRTAEASYETFSSERAEEEGRQELLETYPALAGETLYIRKELKEEALSELEEAMLLPELIAYSLGDASEGAQMLPEESIRDSFVESLNGVSDTMQEQAALSYVKGEYEAIGVDLDGWQMRYLLRTGGKMLGMAFLIMAAMIAVGYLASWVSAAVGRDLRGSVFGKVVSFSNAEIDRFSTASLITRSTNDIQQVQMVAVMLLRMVFYAPILGIGGFIKVMRTTPSMAWIIGIAVLGIICMVAVLMAAAMPKFNRMQTLVDRVNLVAREMLTGLPVIRAFSREKFEEKRFEKANRDLTKNSLFTSRVMTVMMPAMTLLMNGVTVLIVWVGAKGIDLGNLQVGDMMAFITYTMQIVMSFLMLTMMSIMLPRAMVAAKRIDEILSVETTILDPAEPKERKEKRGLLEFDHVSFRYPEACEDALEDITFTAKPGETTAIIGSTGCGKSTLIRLIPRFYDVTGGRILLDGVDIREIPQKELREELGYVPQKGVLFTGTIADNLRYGRRDASAEDLAKASAIAQASEFIESRQDGYDSLISQGGTNVSGGQKQRLSIARAIARRPKVYLFDDSFSALDYKTDATLRRALKEEVSDSTVILVAQRISTILHAEQILVLEEGRIVGRGTHEELMKSCETYQQIAKSQLSSAELGLEKAEAGKEERADE